METLFPGIVAGVWFLIVLGAVWSSAWKGIALWRAARNNHLGWYIALLIVNTLGILEIIYIFAVSKSKAATPQSN